MRSSVIAEVILPPADCKGVCPYCQSEKDILNSYGFRDTDIYTRIDMYFCHEGVCCNVHTYTHTSVIYIIPNS